MLKPVIALRYWHTLRHLKPIQFYARIQFQLFGLYGSRRGFVTPPPEVRFIVSGWQYPISQEISLLGPRLFQLLNKNHELSPFGGWNDSGLEKLWLYNLHYFGDLTAKNALSRIAWHKDLIVDWIASNPPSIGNGWEPYPTALRIVNWVKWSLAGRVLPSFQLPEGFIQSLATQTRWLMKRLEWHLLGNHLFANAKALVFAGVYFQGEEAENWLKQGLEIIARELDEQILKDGGNFERSPMYHAIFLEDLLDLINLSKTYPGLVDAKSENHWLEVVRKMLDWLQWMSHPDGQIGLFNDAAFGVAPTITDLQAYAQRLEIGIVENDNFDSQVSHHIAIKHLKDSGYIRLASKKAIALLDVAPVGPDYLPGHAHADTLSFELSVFGQRVIVNGGTSCYGRSSKRLRERQTVSHSTVEIDGQSSSEVWGGFRVARRASPFDLAVSSDSGEVIVSCSHNGYRRLPGKPVHRRTWVFKEDAIEVRDVIFGSYSQAIARFIVHPDVVVSEVGKGVWQLKLAHGEFIIFVIDRGAGHLENAFYAPEFGKALETKCLAVNLHNASSSIQLRWN